jgi:replicative DNA helicase
MTVFQVCQMRLGGLNLMQYDHESEKLILAAILNDETALVECLADINEEDFYLPQHRAIYKVIASLFAKSIKLSYLEVTKEGMKTGLMKDAQFIFEIAQYHVTSEGLRYWITNIKDMTKLRKLKTLLLRVEDKIKTNPDVDQIINDMENGLVSLIMSAKENIDTSHDLADLGRKAFSEARENRGKLIGIPTGLGKLNRLTNGWKKGDLILLAGETGKGKTAFSLNFIGIGCMACGYPTLYINSEMSKQQVIFRFGSMLSGIKNDTIKFGEADTAEESKFEAAMRMVEGAPFYHYKSPSLELRNVVSTIRRAKIQNNIQFVVIDYVGRMNKTGDDLKEWQVLEQIVKTLKTLAQELEIPIMVLAQLNDDQRLQGAKRMENEADIFLKVQPLDDEEQRQLEAKYPKRPPNYQIWVKKNRDGISEVSVPVQFIKQTLSFIDVTS